MGNSIIASKFRKGGGVRPKKKVVFSVGYFAGFFSEINNMIFAIIYCKKNNIKFTINSKNSAIFGEKGWEEYFEPFTTEAQKPIPSKINFRMTTNYKYRLKDILRIFIYKISTGTDYLTFDIWDKFFYDQHYTKEECFNISNKIWKYNKKTAALINEKIKSLNLPETFVAIHLKGGDKIIETPQLYSPDDLMYVLTRISHNKNVFVFCDEYKTIEFLKNAYPDYNFYTLCSPEEKGYDNTKFQQLDWEIRHNRIINLLTTIELCEKAEIFVGTYHANPDAFLDWRRSKTILLPLNVDKFRENKEDFIKSNL